MVTVEAPEGIGTFSQPRYLPVPLGDQTLPSTLPLKLAPGLFIATVMFISLSADGFVGVIVTPVMEGLVADGALSGSTTISMVCSEKCGTYIINCALTPS